MSEEFQKRWKLAGEMMEAFFQLPEEKAETFARMVRRAAAASGSVEQSKQDRRARHNVMKEVSGWTSTLGSSKRL